MARQREHILPLSGRPLPDRPAWLFENQFLIEAGHRSLKTESTYRSGLRLFADWLQYYKKNGYSQEDEWPLSPQRLSTAVYGDLFGENAPRIRSDVVSAGEALDLGLLEGGLHALGRDVAEGLDAFQAHRWQQAREVFEALLKDGVYNLRIPFSSDER